MNGDYPNGTKIKQEYPPAFYGGVASSMSSQTGLWNPQTQLPKEQLEQLKGIYSGAFSLEMRTQMSDWIVSKIAPNGFLQPQVFDPQNVPEHQEIANNLGNEMLLHLSVANPQAFENFKHGFTNPAELYMTVRNCLELEMNVIAQVPELAWQAPGQESAEEQRKDLEIKQRIEFLKQKVLETGSALDQYRQLQEKFTSDYWTFKDRVHNCECLRQEKGDADPYVVKYKTENEKLKGAISSQYAQLNQHQTHLLSMMTELFDNIKGVQGVVLDQELIGWKQRQKLAGNGYKLDNTKLDRLQVWCEGLADLIWNMRQQVRTLECLRNKIENKQQQQTSEMDPTAQHIQSLVSGITELLSNLVTGTFVIEKQPPQVMKTNTRFPATVRLLVGGALNIHMGAPTVSVSIVNETQANQLLSHASQLPKKKEDYSSGDIINNQANMEYHSTTKQVSCAFRNLQLKKIKRAEKKGQESVMDEKFAILFWTEFQVSELKFQLWTFSLPVVVIVHGNQESQALSTIVWDNGFAEWGRKAYVVAEKVPWQKMGEVLSMKWESACGAPLTEENLYFLACKALRNNNLSRHDYNNQTVSWQYFCKELLPDRTFTFWEWFYRALELTHYRMKDLWKDRYIMGFVDKGAAQRILMERPVGSFLLRFSDSELGGVTIAFKTQNSQNGECQVESLLPWVKKDLDVKPITESIFDLHCLSCVVGSSMGQEIPKDMLRGYLKEQVTRTEPGTGKCNPGYIKTVFKTHIEGDNSSSGPTTCMTPNINSPPQHSALTDFERILSGCETQDSLGMHSGAGGGGTQFNSLDFLELMDDAGQMNFDTFPTQ